jgi:hypothetical protein
LRPFGPSPGAGGLVEWQKVQTHVEVRQMKRVLPFLFTALVVAAVFALVALMTTHRGEEIRAEMTKLGKKMTEAAAEELDEAADKLEEAAEKI